MGLMDDIKEDALKKHVLTNGNELEITQTLNRLLYLPTNVEAETEFVHMVMLKNGEAKERVGLHASSIITSDKDFCYREQVLSLFYEQSQGETIPIELKRIFEEGNAIHEKWQRLFIRGKLGTARDMDRSRFRKKYDLSYTPDACPLIINGTEYVCEIKSVNTYQFQKMQSHPSGKKQLMLYMFLTGIHNGFVLCEDKNTQDIKVYHYIYDPDFIELFIERLEMIQYYKKRLIKEGKLVKGLCFTSDCKRAMKCNMRLTCWHLNGGGKRLILE